MISNFNTLVDTVASMYFNPSELAGENDKPSPIMKHLRRELAKDYLPQLDFEELESVVDRVKLAAIDDRLEDKIANAKLTDDDVEEIVNKSKE